MRLEISVYGTVYGCFRNRLGLQRYGRIPYMVRCAALEMRRHPIVISTKSVLIPPVIPITRLYAFPPRANFLQRYEHTVIVVAALNERTVLKRPVHRKPYGGENIKHDDDGMQECTA